MTSAEAAAAVALLAAVERDEVAYAWPIDAAAVDAAHARYGEILDAVDAAYRGAHAWIYGDPKES